MADIVQLKEDGVAKYLKTHANAIDGVDGVLVKATGNETILGTKNFQDGLQFAGKNVLVAPIVRTLGDSNRIDENVTYLVGHLVRQGNIVTVQGYFKSKINGAVNIFRVPEGFRCSTYNVDKVPMDGVNVNDESVIAFYNVASNHNVKASGNVGNTYFHGSWYTTDSYPS